MARLDTSQMSDEQAAPKTYRVAVFTHKDGWQFMIPGCWADPDDHDGPDDASLIIDAVMLGVGVNCKVTWVNVPVNSDGLADLPHEEGKLIGRQFAHGAIKVLKLIGPLSGVHHYD